MSTNLENRSRKRKTEKKRKLGDKPAKLNEKMSLSEIDSVKMSDSEKKVNKNTCDISSIKRVNRKFLEVSRCSRAKQRQRNVQIK